MMVDVPTRLPVLVVLVVALMLLAAGRAAAATTIGQTSTAVPPTSVATSGAALLQRVDPVGTSYAVPAGGGVVTSMRATVGAGTGVAASARVFLYRGPEPSVRIVGGGTISFVGASAFSVQTIATRVPVQAGDRLAAYVPSAGGAVIGAAGGGSIRFVPSATAPADGSTFSTAGGTDDAKALMVSATIEPDADRDGYGDETQDSCPTIASIQSGACTTDLTVSMRARPTNLPRGDISTLIGTVTAARTAPGSTARLELPAGLQLVVASTTGGECIAFTCSLGTIPAGEPRRVFVVVRALTSGLKTTRLSATSALADTNAADNTGMTQVEVSKAVLSTAPTYCKVPKLRGRTRKAARRALKKAGCRAGRASGAKGKRARVRRQAIPAGVRVAAGTKVAFRLKKKR